MDNNLTDDYAITYFDKTPFFHTASFAHPFYEIILVTKGTIDYLVDRQNISLKESSMLLLSPNTKHHPLSLPENATRYVLWIHARYLNSICTAKTDLKQAFYHNKTTSFQHLELDLFSFEKILSGFSTIYDAENSITFLGKDIVQRTLLQQLLVLINRVSANMSSYLSMEQSLSKSDVLEEQVMLYISRHLQDNLTNQEIADYFQFNKDYLNRRFKQYCGCSIHSFINQKRLEYATQLLKRGVPLNELASKSGFNDYTNFYKLFKQTYGVTPKEYKLEYTIF